MWALLHMAKFTECVTEVRNSCNLKNELLPPQGFHPEGEIQRRHSTNSHVY